MTDIPDNVDDILYEILEEFQQEGLTIVEAHDQILEHFTLILDSHLDRPKEELALDDNTEEFILYGWDEWEGFVASVGGLSRMEGEFTVCELRGMIIARVQQDDDGDIICTVKKDYIPMLMDVLD